MKYIRLFEEEDHSDMLEDVLAAMEKFCTVGGEVILRENGTLNYNSDEPVLIAESQKRIWEKYIEKIGRKDGLALLKGMDEDIAYSENYDGHTISVRSSLMSEFYAITGLPPEITKIANSHGFTLSEKSVCFDGFELAFDPGIHPVIDMFFQFKKDPEMQHKHRGKINSKRFGLR